MRADNLRPPTGQTGQTFKVDFPSDSPLAQKAKLGFKLLLLERLNENLKQKHF